MKNPMDNSLISWVHHSDIASPSSLGPGEPRYFTWGRWAEVLAGTCLRIFSMEKFHGTNSQQHHKSSIKSQKMSHVSYVKWKIMAGNSEFELLVSWISCCQLYPIWPFDWFASSVITHRKLPNKINGWFFHVKIIGKYRNAIFVNEGFRRVVYRRTFWPWFSSHLFWRDEKSPGGFKHIYCPFIFSRKWWSRWSTTMK